MSAQEKQKTFEVIDWLVYRGAYLGGWMAIILMGLTCTDVMGRLFFASPVPAAYETTETILIPCLVYFSMARGNHITINWVTERLRGKALFSVNIIKHLLSVTCMAFLSYAALSAARTAYQQDVHSEAVISLPTWPAYWVVAAGLALLLIARVALFLKLFRGGSR